MSGKSRFDTSPNVKGIGITLDDRSLDVIRRVSIETGIGNVSATIRYVLADWDKTRNAKVKRQ